MRELTAAVDVIIIIQWCDGGGGSRYVRDLFIANWSFPGYEI